MNTKQMAKKLASLGRGDDTMLAHINSREAAMLKRAGGSGKINPNTGIVEFDDTGDSYSSPSSFSWSPPPSGGQGFTPSAPTSNFGMTYGDSGLGSSVSAGFGQLGGGQSQFNGTSDFNSGTGGGGYAPSLNFAFGGAGAADTGGFGGDVPGFSPDMLPAADNAYDRAPPEMPGQSDSNPIVEFFKRLATGKAWQLGAKALGIPGMALGLIGPIRAASNAPEGKGTEEFMRALGIGAGNTALNQATGGMAGAMGLNTNDIAGRGPVTTNDPGRGGAPNRYDPSVDYARGAAGLLGAYNFAQLGKGSSSERAAEDKANELIRDPSAVTRMPGFEAGKMAVERAAAGRGYLSSGNLNVALAKYGDQFYNNALSTFSKISQQNAAIRNNYNTNSTALALQSLGSLGYAYMKSNNKFDGPQMQQAPTQAPSDLMDWGG